MRMQKKPQFDKLQVVRLHRKDYCIIFNLPDFIFHNATKDFFKKQQGFYMETNKLIRYLFKPTEHKFFTYQLFSRGELDIFFDNPNGIPGRDGQFHLSGKVGKIRLNGNRACFVITKKTIEEVKKEYPDFLEDLLWYEARSSYVFYLYSKEMNVLRIFPNLSQQRLLEIFTKTNFLTYSFDFIKQQFFDIVPLRLVPEKCEKILREMIRNNGDIIYAEGTDQYRLRRDNELPKPKKLTRKEIWLQNLERYGAVSEQDKTEVIINQILNCKIQLQNNFSILQSLGNLKSKSPVTSSKVIKNDGNYKEIEFKKDGDSVKEEKNVINKKNEKFEQNKDDDEIKKFYLQICEKNKAIDLENSLSMNEKNDLRRYRAILSRIGYGFDPDWPEEEFFKRFIIKINNPNPSELEKKLIEELQAAKQKKYEYILFREREGADLGKNERNYIEKFKIEEHNVKFY